MEGQAPVVIGNIIWGRALIFLCLFCGIYFSVRTRFMQIRLFGAMLKTIFDSPASRNGLSSFQSLMVSLSGRVGTGNIAGTATAIYYGGPGAMFWMWVIAFLGAASAFVESALAQLWKKEIDGEYRGGPPYYIEAGLKNRTYAKIFSVIAIFSCGIFMPGVQANAVSVSMFNGCGIAPALTAGGIIVALALIIVGGTKMIARASEIIVPVMALMYIGVTFIIIFLNIEKLPTVIMQIITAAIGRDAVFGGIFGSAINWGVKRGIYSNEAGQGTGAYAAAAAEISHPAKQGLVQAFSVYIDTLLICSATGFMLLLTECYNVSGGGEMLVENIENIAPGPVYAQAAVSTILPNFGAAFIAIALALFAFTSLISLYYQAETNISYLFRLPKLRSLASRLMQVLFLLFVFISCINSSQYAWAMGDIGAGFLAWGNIFAILQLQAPALWLLKDYEQQRKAGLDPCLNPDKLGIGGTELWRKINRNRF